MEVIFNPRGKENVRLEGKLQWDKKSYPDAPAIIACHGFLGSCDGTIKEYGKFLEENGYCFFGISLRGHGNSGGKRGFISLNTCLEDIGGAVDYLKKLNKNKIGFCGLSVGAAAGLFYIVKNPNHIQAISLISLFVNIESVKLSNEEKSGLDEICESFEKFGKDTTLEFKRNRKMFPISAYKSLRDEFNVFSISSKIPDIPLLMIMASHDDWIKPRSMQDFFASLEIPYKEIKTYTDSTHELNTKRYYVKRKLVEFFNTHLK